MKSSAKQDAGSDMNSRQAGSAIILALIASIAVSLIASVVSGYFLKIRQSQNRQNLLTSVAQIQLKVLELINSDAAWDITKANNAVPTNVPSLFTLYDANGGVAYDSTNLLAGFTPGGNFCANWSGAGSAICPLRLELSWRQIAICNGIAVASYQISGTYNYQPEDLSQATTLNWQAYANQLSFCRPVATQSFSCIGAPPASPCLAPNFWFCTLTGWRCGRIFN